MKKSEVLKLKERVEEAKTKVSKLEGRRDGLMQELTDKWECENLEQAVDLLEELGTEITKLETKLEKQLTKLKKEFENVG